METRMSPSRHDDLYIEEDDQDEERAYDHDESGTQRQSKT